MLSANLIIIFRERLGNVPCLVGRNESKRAARGINAIGNSDSVKKEIIIGEKGGQKFIGS